MAKEDQTKPEDDAFKQIEDAIKEAGEAEISHSTIFMEKGPRIQLQHIMKLCADSALKEVQTMSGLGLSETRREKVQADIEEIKTFADANFQEVPDMLTGQDRGKKIEYLTQYSGFLLDQCRDIDGILTGARTSCQGGGVDHHKTLFMAHYQSAIDQIFGFKDEKGHDKKGLYLSEEDSGAYKLKLETLQREIEQKYKTMDSDEYAVFVIDMNSEIDKILQEARDLRKQAVNGKARERFEVSEEETGGLSSIFASDPESLTRAPEGQEDEEEAEIIEEGEEARTSADDIRDVTEEGKAAYEEEKRRKIFEYSFEANFNANMKDYRKATVYFQEVEKLDPKNANANAFLESEEAKPYIGMTLDQLKDAEDAEKKAAEEKRKADQEAFEQGFQANYSTAFTLATEANFHRNMGDFESATLRYQDLIAIDPEHTEAKAFLASEHAKPYLEAQKDAADRFTKFFGEDRGEAGEVSPDDELDRILGKGTPSEEGEELLGQGEAEAQEE